MTEKVATLLRDKASARWTALILLAMAMFFSYVFMDILSPIKDLLESTCSWDPDAFGTYAGSETFLTVFIFFLIIAGIILDKMGVRFTAIRCHYQLVCGDGVFYGVVTQSVVRQPS